MFEPTMKGTASPMNLMPRMDRMPEMAGNQMDDEKRAAMVNAFKAMEKDNPPPQTRPVNFPGQPATMPPLAEIIRRMRAR